MFLPHRGTRPERPVHLSNVPVASVIAGVHGGNPPVMSKQNW